MLAAPSRSSSLILLMYDGMSIPPGHDDEQEVPATLVAPNIEWYLLSPTAA